MKTKISYILKPKTVQTLSIGAMCVLGSFFAGVQTVGDVQPISLIEAGGVIEPGDINGDGYVSNDDAMLILEIVQGCRDPTAEELLADPNGDGILTIEDARQILDLLPTI